MVEGIYQIRGYDPTNITFIAVASGWIVFNPLIAEDAALLFDAICKRYEQGSVILASNKSYADWAEIFSGDAVMVLSASC